MASQTETSSETGAKVTVSTRLSSAEAEAFEALAKRNDMTPSRFLHDLVIMALSRGGGSNPVDPVLVEVVGIRLLLVNLLRPVAIAGEQPYSAAAYDHLLEEIKKVKPAIALEVKNAAEAR